MRLMPLPALLLSLSLAVFGSLSGARAQGLQPLPLVQGFYVPGFDENEMPLSTRLRGLLDAAIENSRKLAAPVAGLDFAWTLGAQDAEPGYESTLRFSEVAQDGLRATVRVTFRNGRDEEILYELLRENGVWTVDDMRGLRGDPWVLSELLIDGANEK